MRPGSLRASKEIASSPDITKWASQNAQASSNARTVIVPKKGVTDKRYSDSRSRPGCFRARTFRVAVYVLRARDRWLAFSALRIEALRLARPEDQHEASVFWNPWIALYASQGVLSR